MVVRLDRALARRSGDGSRRCRVLARLRFRRLAGLVDLGGCLLLVVLLPDRGWRLGLFSVVLTRLHHVTSWRSRALVREEQPRCHAPPSWPLSIEYGRCLAAPKARRT